MMNLTRRWIWCSLLMLSIPFTALPAHTQTESAADSLELFEEARVLVEEAISLGVPLYNGGQAAACAAIYRMMLRSLQVLAPSAVDSAGIERALRMADTESPSRAAWTLRYALDDVYAGVEMAGVETEETAFRIDFTSGRNRWATVNDNVMGGVSRGGLTISDGIGRFTGQLSMRNNGGFSSARTEIVGAALSGYDGVEMRVRGDGRVYALLAAPRNARGSWQQDFRTTGQWQTIRVAFESMALSVRGWRPANAPTLRGRDVGMLGMLIADKRTDPFELEIDWIKGYSNEPTIQ